MPKNETSNRHLTKRASRVIAKLAGKDIITGYDLLLILLGEPTSAAVHSLRHKGVSPDALAQRLRELLPQPSKSTTMKSHSGWLESAAEEAAKLNHPYIGTEHLLLAALHDESRSERETLDQLGISYPQARDGVTALLYGEG